MRQKLISFPLFIIERDFQLGGKACCANYSIHEPFRKYVMDFTRLFTGKQGTLQSARWLRVITLPEYIQSLLSEELFKNNQTGNSLFDFPGHCLVVSEP